MKMIKKTLAECGELGVILKATGRRNGIASLIYDGDPLHAKGSLSWVPGDQCHAPADLFQESHLLRIAWTQRLYSHRYEMMGSSQSGIL